MKIGIISDTHDQILRVKQAVGIFTDNKADMVVHCGDIVSPFTLQFYRELKCPIKFLLGNNTGDIRLHIEYAQNFGLANCEFGIFFSFEAGGKLIAAYHGEEPEITNALLKCGEYDCVFSGHDHTAKIEMVSDTLHVNPGTLMDKHKENMAAPSVAIYDSESNEAKLIELLPDRAVILY